MSVLLLADITCGMLSWPLNFVSYDNTIIHPERDVKRNIGLKEFLSIIYKNSSLFPIFIVL